MLPIDVAYRLLKDDDDEIRRYTWDNDDDESEFPGLASLFGTEEEQREKMRLEREKRVASDERMREEEERREKIRQGELPRPFAMHTQQELEGMVIQGWADDEDGSSHFVDDPKTREQIFDEMNIRGYIEGSDIQDNVNTTVFETHLSGEQLDPNIDIMSADERQDFQEKNASEPMDIAYRLLKDYTIAPSHDEVMDFMQTIQDQNVDMEGDGDDDCCEKVRQHLLERWKEDEPGNPDDPEEDSFNTPYWLNWLENLSCERLQQEFAYDEIANYVGCAGFNESDQMKWASEPMDIAYRLLKARQTKLYNWIQDYPGKDPVQQMSAQPSAYKDNYLEGEYPDEFWSFIGDNPEDTESHGASRHRSDEEGNYLAVGVRGQSPIGELPTRGPARNIPDGGGVRVVGKDDMPDPDDIVVMPKNASHMNNFDPKQKGQFRKPRVRISQ